MYAKPRAIVVLILHTLIPDKNWTGKHLLWIWTSFKSTFGRSDKILGFLGFISPSIFPILHFKNLYIWPKTLFKPYLQANNDNFTTFSNILVTKHVGYWTSEVDKYLCKPVENVKDPLKWWVANCHIYPNLHHMALDYLSIPGALFIYGHSQSCN